MRHSRWIIPSLAGLLTLCVASGAEAKPQATSLQKSKPSFYLYGAPLFMAAPIGDDDITDFVDVSYQWGFGLGGLWAVGRKRNFGIGFGFGFEHNPATLDDDYDDVCNAFDADCSFHAFRFLPELRIGGIWDQLIAYGYVAPGFAMTFARFDGLFVGDETDVDPGFNFGFGGGAQYVVWKGLFVGGELGFDMGVYANSEDDFDDNNYGVYLFDFKALVGYYF